MAMNLAQTERNPVVVVGRPTDTDFLCDANIPIILRYGDPLVVSSKYSTLLSCNHLLVTGSNIVYVHTLLVDVSVPRERQTESPTSTAQLW